MKQRERIFIKLFGFGLYSDKSFVNYGGVHNIELIYLSWKENKVYESSFSATGETMHTPR